MDSFFLFFYSNPDTAYGNTHTPAFNRSLPPRASLTCLTRARNLIDVTMTAYSLSTFILL